MWLCTTLRSVLKEEIEVYHNISTICCCLAAVHLPPATSSQVSHARLSCGKAKSKCAPFILFVCLYTQK